MKKIYVVFIFSFLTMILSSCFILPNTVELSKEKYDIVSNKYGEVEYLNEQIMIYDNLKELFDEVTGVNYIIDNSADRGSVAPELKKHFYLFVDIIMHEDEIKMLLYNNLMKKGKDKEKMFILTDYNLPIRLEVIEELFLDDNSELNLKDFSVNVLKKERSIRNNLLNHDELSMAYYEKSKYYVTFMSAYDNASGNVIVGDRYSYFFGNVKDKVIYTPYIDYVDVVNTNYDTLLDEEVLYNLDIDKRKNCSSTILEEFEIVKEERNNEVKYSLFYSAFNYSELLTLVDNVSSDEVFFEYSDYEDEINSLVLVYDEEFFLNNILIFYYQYDPSASPNHIYSLTKKADTLTVNVNRMQSNLGWIGSCLNILTVSKEDLLEINNVDLIVRTVEPIQRAVSFYIEKDYMRNFYLNGYTMDDFKDVDNLLLINEHKDSLRVDLIINSEITDNDLTRIINYLENSPSVLSLGRQGKDFIRINMADSFYDEVVNDTLKLEDFIFDEQLLRDFDFKVQSTTTIIGSGRISFALINPSRENIELMIEELNKDKYPFLVKKNSYPYGYGSD